MRRPFNRAMTQTLEDITQALVFADQADGPTAGDATEGDGDEIGELPDDGDVADLGRELMVRNAAGRPVDG